MRLVILLAIALAVVACGPKPATLEDMNTRLVTLPNGQGIRAEVMSATQDMMRGMMFRDALAADRGMLFVHQQPGNYPYWMFQVRIPLDMIWMARATAGTRRRNTSWNWPAEWRRSTG
jgi:hypothetical protein